MPEEALEIALEAVWEFNVILISVHGVICVNLFLLLKQFDSSSDGKHNLLLTKLVINEFRFFLPT